MNSTDQTTAQPTSPSPDAEYVLGTNQAEMQRLGFQHRLWSVPAHRLWQRAGLRQGVSVLDAGCGPGFASLEMAQLVTHTGRVVGVDESAPFVGFASAQAQSRGLPHASFFEGDVAQIDRVLGAQGIEPGSFDIVYMRWVMCFVPDPASALKAVWRMLRPGGRLCVQDYFAYDSMCASPNSDTFKTIIDAIARSWRDRGGDPDIMGRLPAMAHDLGMGLDHIARVETPAARPGMPMWDWPDSFWGVFLPRLEELGYITGDQHRAFMAQWATLSANPAAFMHLPPVYEMIATKPE